MPPKFSAAGKRKLSSSSDALLQRDGKKVKTCQVDLSNSEPVVWFCDGCQKIIPSGTTRYDCVQCGAEEFVFCITCKLVKNHPHPLELNSGDVHLSAQLQANSASNPSSSDCSDNDSCSSSDSDCRSSSEKVISKRSYDDRIAQLEKELEESSDDEYSSEDDSAVPDWAKAQTVKIKCHICMKEFNSDAQLQQHCLSKAHKEKAALVEAKDYVPSQRKPLYCRCCSLGFGTVEELLKHRGSFIHKQAEKREREQSYCVLCKKQFTSVLQLAEHCKGGKHREQKKIYEQSKFGGRGRGRGGRGDAYYLNLPTQ